VAEDELDRFPAPLDAPVRYGVVPVLKDGDTKVKPRPMLPRPDRLCLRHAVRPVEAVVQPRHDLGTMAVACDRPDVKPAQTLDKAISTKGNKIRDFLKGQLGARLLALLADARTSKHDVYLALTSSTIRTDHRADRSQGEGALSCSATHRKVRRHGKGHQRECRRAEEGRRRHRSPQDRAEPLRTQQVRDILRWHAKAEGVWTGSTNWTRTGLCTQNNNGLEITDDKIAAAYHEHWKLIYA